MPRPGAPPRVTVSASLLALLCGLALGALTFAGAAALWRAGQPRIAGGAAEAMLLAALVLVAAVSLLGEPASRRRARVPIGRALPPAWFGSARGTDPLPVLVACVGGPVAVGAVAAFLLFR